MIDENRIEELLEKYRDRSYEKVEMELSEHLRGAALKSAVKKRLDDECKEFEAEMREHWDDADWWKPLRL